MPNAGTALLRPLLFTFATHTTIASPKTLILVKEIGGISFRNLDEYQDRADSTMSQAGSRFEVRMSKSETLTKEFYDILTALSRPETPNCQT